MAVLVAGLSAADGPVGRMMAARGVQWLGDVSYSVYLWHWPLIVLLPAVSGTFGLADQAVILVVTLVLATLTKQFVEDPCRIARLSTRRVFGAAALGMALVFALSASQLAEVGVRERRSTAALQRAQADQNPCLGAGTLTDPPGCADAHFDTVVPAPAQAAMDKAAAYEDVGGRNCWSSGPQFALVTCSFGRDNGGKRIALVGNSHAGQWLPTLEALAGSEDLSITTFLASRCAYAATPQNLPTDGQTRACRTWVDHVTAALLTGNFDAVVLSNRRSASAEGSTSDADSQRAYQAGYAAVLRELSGKVPLLALHDTPAPGDAGVESAPDCVAANADVAACSGPRGDWVPAEPLDPAFRSVRPPHSRLVDANDAICGPRTCSAVVGGVLVYSDGSHLSATYARTLAPVIGKELRRVLDH